MEDQALLATQELAPEAAVVEQPRRRYPFAVMLLGMLAMTAVFGKIAVPAAQHGSSSTDGVVRLAEMVPEGAAADAAESKPKPQAAKAAAKAGEQAAAASATAIKAAEQLTDDAKNFKQHSDKLKSDATALDKKTKDMEQHVADTKEKADSDRDAAKKARSQAEELRQKAEELKNQAKDLDVKATGLDQDAVSKDGEATKSEQEAEQLSQQEKSLEEEAGKERQRAVDTEEKALGQTAAARTCFQLPGVKLEGKDSHRFAPVVGEHNITDDVQCQDWCLKHEDCKQSVFTWETKTCELFAESSTQPIFFRDAWPWYNTSYCGLVSEKESMLADLHKVFDQKPWVTPAHNCSWGGENCIETKCCADSCKANWDWTECKAFTCWKRDENWAGCKIEGSPDPSWDGENLGGHPNWEIPPVEDGKLIQGTRLYCFTVVMWQQAPMEGWMNSEAELANNWKDQGKGILQCDDYSMFDGLEGGSVHNIQSFIRAWKMVKDDGRWKNNDWSVKVDADAVFFPDHLRKKIQWVYKTPQGAAVYLRNTHYKFQFLGALEALTREALEVYFQRGWECEAHLGQEGGEDYWLQQCLEGIGVDYQTDITLLHDKYANDENCGDPNGVAHHFFKKVDQWDVCWNMANEAWNNEHGE